MSNFQAYDKKIFGGYILKTNPWIYVFYNKENDRELEFILAESPANGIVANIPSYGSDTTVQISSDFSFTGKIDFVLKGSSRTVDGKTQVSFNIGTRGVIFYDLPVDASSYNFWYVRIINSSSGLSGTNDSTLGCTIMQIGTLGGSVTFNCAGPGNTFSGSYNLSIDSNNYMNNLSLAYSKYVSSSNTTYYHANPIYFNGLSIIDLPIAGTVPVSNPTSSGPSATPVATTPAGSPATAPTSSPPPSIKAYNVQIANCGAAYIKGAILTCKQFSSGQTSIPTRAIIHLVEDANTGAFKYPGDSSPISFYIDGISFNGRALSYKRYNSASEPIAIYELIAGALDDTSVSDKLLGDTVGALNINVYINENGTQDAILDPNGISFGTTKFEYVTAGFGNSPPSNYGTAVSWNSFGQNASAISISNLIYKSHTYVGPSVEVLQFDKTVATPVINVYAKTTSSTAPASVPSPTAGGSSSTTTTGTGSTATTTTTNTNAFGAGTIVTVAPNTQSLPAGTTTTVEVINGLTITTTVTVDAATNKVTTTKNTSFTPSLNTANPQLANKRRALMGIPNDFQGAIDPTVAFPSTQIAGKFGNSQSGVFFQANVSPTSFDLDPYFFFTENTVFQTGVNKQLKPLYGSGVAYKNDFQVVAKDGYSDGSNINIRKVPYNNNVRTMGFRGPVVLSGWGYDVRGLPVPNASNETIQTGVYTNPNTGKETALYGLDPSGQYKFNPKTPVRRNLWKSGPVDLRWHDERKVWTGGQEILEGYLLESLNSPVSTSGNGSSTTATMSVLRVAGPSGLTGQNFMSIPPSSLYDSQGRKTGVAPAKFINEFITVTNRDPSLSASAGTYIMAIDINYEWRPIYIGC